MGVPLRRRSGRSVYRESTPAYAVAGVVESVWTGVVGDSRPLRVFPDGCVDLVWDGRRLDAVTTVRGVLRHELPSVDWTVGLRLRCGVGGAVLGLPMTELAAGATPLRDLWSARARRAESSLAECGTPGEARSVLEALVTDRLRDIEPDGLSVAAARALRAPGARADKVAAELGVSERGLRRHVRHDVGVGPKELQRVLRFHRFLTRLEAVVQDGSSLADVAAEVGYADQSHLGRECRRLSGVSPGALVRSWTGRNVPDRDGPPRRRS
ncbi:AraC family transcriptional regulator [Amycolatopsis sp. WAC 01416]|uniref:helix-turn-helix domain-containing protein n=1 Tax=Amycolatopsis sp. WAC 01416 TaxID=2203196 RepID=UPI000F7737AF|nr:helix-turn-helix domain-containing protein [Amycolatopsis sp. WAC 01416]RSN33225.1 AraC family transcriptional regulator [Amycolatopsis sp. WAC 01416]